MYDLDVVEPTCVNRGVVTVEIQRRYSEHTQWTSVLHGSCAVNERRSKKKKKKKKNDEGAKVVNCII